MKILILGNLHSLAGLQDALSGKGLPPIPVELEAAMQFRPSGPAFDCVLLDGMPPFPSSITPARALSSRALIRALQSRARQKTAMTDDPMATEEAGGGAVVFEYHAPCGGNRTP